MWTTRRWRFAEDVALNSMSKAKSHAPSNSAAPVRHVVDVQRRWPPDYGYPGRRVDGYKSARTTLSTDVSG
jgi:hypothetical protein